MYPLGEDVALDGQDLVPVVCMSNGGAINSIKLSNCLGTHTVGAVSLSGPCSTVKEYHNINHHVKEKEASLSENVEMTTTLDQGSMKIANARDEGRNDETAWKLRENRLTEDAMERLRDGSFRVQELRAELTAKARGAGSDKRDGDSWGCGVAEDGKEGRPLVHVVAIPYPAHGHIVPLMQLCRKLVSNANFLVTFVNTEHMHSKAIQSASYGVDGEKSWPTAEANLGGAAKQNGVGYEGGAECCHGRIRMVSIPGGLPPELHEVPEQAVAALKASEALLPAFQNLLHRLNLEGPRVTHIISDAMVSWTQLSADELCIPRLALWTSSASVLHAVWRMFDLVLGGCPSFKAAITAKEEMERMVEWIPGLPPIALDDLPVELQSDDANPGYLFLLRQLQPLQKAACILANTIPGMEDEALCGLRAINSCPPVIAVGPLLPPKYIPTRAGLSNKMDTISSAGKENIEEIIGAAAVDSRFRSPSAVESGHVRTNTQSSHITRSHGAHDMVSKVESVQPDGTPAAVSVPGLIDPSPARGRLKMRDSIQEDELGCLQWLHQQAPRSVLYIAFGSLVRMEPAQFSELAAGLEQSGVPFLWSVRPGFVDGGSYMDKLPASFIDATSGRGIITSWVPQLEVLAHPSIAGFLTHCGWNSIQESLCMGVPLLCWPKPGERTINALLATLKWRTGLHFTAKSSREVADPHFRSKEDVSSIMREFMGSSPASQLVRSKAKDLHEFTQNFLSTNTPNWNLLLHLLSFGFHHLHFT
ncbi:hypothetical protein KP509_11G026600 [Ceratopteris richardii]|uniref:UDP-glycosyltransferases domain-containing protein n=1 Tax=Ceratopteris richardii TaxID=49495 RepID=A0A8T2TRA1_CERRI|nr:hypothetical protein KP509_11G026600 [Ceratopteris richardii]